MTVSKLDAPVYTDLKGLSALRRGAGDNDPAAIRKVAEQFESMFTRIMLKSMRDAVGTDPMFGSDQQKMYQDMADDQLSIELSKGRGLGLADMLIKQLQKLGVKGAEDASQAGAVGGAASAAAAYTATQRAASNPAAASESGKEDFIRTMWPHAREAGRQLGVDPRNLVAQAALETNWGQSLPHAAAGRSSNNLFGIKAGPEWSGDAVSAATREYRDGAAADVTARFRAYATPAESFRDYVALLRTSPRFSGALNTGSDVLAFATALQRGGYATDPDYAGKISAIAHKVGSTLGAGALKLAGGPPISTDTGML